MAEGRQWDCLGDGTGVECLGSSTAPPSTILVRGGFRGGAVGAVAPRFVSVNNMRKELLLHTCMHFFEVLTVNISSRRLLVA